jgi:hypothetical protein
MSIPLDNLYDYIEHECEQIWKDRVLIYRFYPHGSKDFSSLEFLHANYSFDDLILCPYVFCNDQEPLNYDFYNQYTHLSEPESQLMQQLSQTKKNLRDYPIEIWDQAVLLHSEQRSSNVELYQQDGFVPAYYWSHGIIARDWFRFAQHVQQHKRVSKTFLIYNRAWSGTREYRLKFAELLIDWQLIDSCKTSFNVTDPDTQNHYHQHNFINATWRPEKDLENYFLSNTSSSNQSAYFDIADYESTDIEVVLETLFDDSRWHLTEKILRPIALAQPFILVSTAGTLDYLRSYGFKTFDGIWSESYDKISDPALRLELIAGVMKTIATWNESTRREKMLQAQQIADYNRQHFFSQHFFNHLQNELVNNLNQAFAQIRQQQTGKNWVGFKTNFRTLLNTVQTTCPIKYVSQESWNNIVSKAKSINAN